MLTDTIFIANSINQWSHILRRTLEFDFISHIHKYRCLSKVLFNNVNMSQENDKYNLLGTPSLRGSIPCNWDCSSMDDTNLNQPVDENNVPKPEEYIPNLVLAERMMSVHNIASNFYLNFYQANNPFYMGQYFQQNLNRQYCQTSRDEYQIRNLGQRNGSASKKQTSYRPLLFSLFLFMYISCVMGNNFEDIKNDQRLLSLRKWENVSGENRSNGPGFIFTLMCYNVLSQDLLVQHPGLYNHHDSASLKWNVRWNNIFNEITKFKPDILCLQEIQESHLDSYFCLLESIGYASLYKRRTGARTDGCALYYKTDLIQLVEHTSVEYLQPNISLLDRDNVGLIAKFSPKLHPTREFVVATTHLLYNPRRQDVRLAQMQLLITEIERISYSSKSDTNYLPVILTGDLNSTPDSAVYQFISKGKLKYENLSPRLLKQGTNEVTGKVLMPAKLRITDNCQHADLLEKRMKNEKLSRTEEMSIIKLFHTENKQEKQTEEKKLDTQLFSTGTLSHNFIFKTVYNHGDSGNNEGTTFQDHWVTVDYIFYSAKKDEANSEDKLKLLSRYRLPTKQELLGVRIPNSVIGSDHLSLLAKFKLEY